MTDNCNILMVWKVSSQNTVRVFIYCGTKHIDDVFEVIDVFLNFWSSWRILSLHQTMLCNLDIYMRWNWLENILAGYGGYKYGSVDQHLNKTISAEKDRGKAGK